MIEKFSGPTPNGGATSEIIYLDDQERSVSKEQATRAIIRELDPEGNLINETVADLKR